MDKKLRAFLELILASLFWGFGFVAAVWALKRWNAVEVSLYRFALAAIAGFLILFLGKNLKSQEFKHALKTVWPASIFLAATLIFQTWGLIYTTATKSGFITTLYILIVPLIEWFFLKVKVKPIFFFWVALALVGTAMLVNLQEVDSFNKGDLMTLLCAFSAAGHIFIVGALANKVRSPFLFNQVQSLCAALFCLPMLLFLPVPAVIEPDLITNIPWIGLSMLAFGSTMFAFYLQVRAQRVLSASVSSFIFLLESPFAFLFAAVLLGETLNSTEASGAILIFIAAGGVVWNENKLSKQRSANT